MPTHRTADLSALPPRLDSLTGLRWFAAFAVFLHHAGNFGSTDMAPVLRFGTYGVTFFFVLSGFVLTWSSRPEVGTTTFYWNRVSRIYPAAFVAFLLALPVFYSFHPDPSQWWVKPVDLGILLLSVPLIQAWWNAPTILFSGNPAAWTLTCEFFFYALHPFIIRPLRRMRARASLWALAALVAAYLVFGLAVAQWPGSWLAQIPQPIAQLPTFVMGMLLAAAMRDGWQLRIHPAVTYIATGAFIGFLVVTAGNTNWFAIKFAETAPQWIAVLCALMIAAVATRDVLRRPSALRRTFWVRLGEWSFCFYLLHAHFVYTARAIWGQQPTGWLNLVWWALLLAVSIAAAAALHHFVEKPAERAMRQWWKRRAEARRVPVLAAEAE